LPGTEDFREFVASIVTGGAETAFDSSNAYIGVGNSAAAFVDTQTDLQGASKSYQPMRPGFPSVVGNEMEFEARFDEETGNHAWLEVGIFNAATAGLMMGRFLQSLDTKTSDEIWDLNVKISIESSES
jgi:hypothetical protein